MGHECILLSDIQHFIRCLQWIVCVLLDGAAAKFEFCVCVRACRRVQGCPHAWPVLCRKELTEEAAQKAAEAAEPDKKGKDKKKK